MSADFHETTQCYIPEDRIFINYHRENLKSHKQKDDCDEWEAMWKKTAMADSKNSASTE
jgi:hypothetical protein